MAVAGVTRRLAGIPSLLPVAGAGLLTGAFGAYAYYSDVWRPLAHVLGPWILLAAVVSARRRPVSAAARSTAALVAAVGAFYVGLDVVYGIKYSGAPHSVNLDRMALWCALAVLAGVTLGLIFHRIGRRGWTAAAATAAALGLLGGDVLRRSLSRAPDPVLLGFLALAVTVVLLLAEGSRQQWARAAVLTVPALALGMVVASAPDALEQLLITGITSRTDMPSPHR